MKLNLMKSLTVLMTGIMLLTTAACSADEKNKAAESTEQPTAASEVKLRILWWGSQSRHDATLKALDLYTQKNPNVTFEPEFSGWEGYWDKLATQSAARNAPDIIQMDASYLAEYAGRNQLADLSAGISTEEIDEALLNTGKYQDKLYAVPLGNNAIGIIYNKEAVEKLGITKPVNGWTWDQFFAFGKEAKAKLGSDKYVFSDFSSSFQQFANYQLSKGLGQVFTDDGKLHLDKDTYLEFQNKFAELRKEGIVPSGEVSVTDKELDPQLDLMVNGTTLLRIAHAAQSNSFDSLKPGIFDFVTIPRNKEAGGWLKPSMFWSASANSEHVEEAKKFIDWFINDPEAAELLGTSRGVPVSNKVVEQLTPKFTASDKMGISLIANTAPDAQLYVPEPKGWSNFAQKDFRAVGEKMMFGEITPEQAYEELMELAKDYE